MSTVCYFMHIYILFDHQSNQNIHKAQWSTNTLLAVYITTCKLIFNGYNVPFESITSMVLKNKALDGEIEKHKLASCYWIT